MKIAFIVNTFPSLSQTFILNQITGIIDRGHEVDIFAWSPGDNPKIHEDVIRYNLQERTFYFPRLPKNNLFRVLRGLGYAIRYFHYRPRIVLRSLNIFKHGKHAASFYLLFKILPFLNADLYDIIHCHFGPNGNLGVLLRDIGAIQGKVLTTLHGYDLTSFVKKRGERIYENLFAKGDLFFPISARWKEELLRLGCNERKIRIHRMGIDTSKFDFNNSRKQINGHVTLLTVGRLEEKKGIKYGILAAAKLRKQFPHIHYLIAGDGPLKEELAQLINKLHLQDNVKLLGWMRQDEIINLMQQADIFLAPSVTAPNGEQEGIPVVIMEAMAKGLPVISTLHSGIPEVVVDGVSGFLVQERDVPALSQKLAQLLKDQALRERMALNAREFIEDNHNITKLNDTLVEIYKSLITTSDQ